MKPVPVPASCPCCDMKLLQTQVVACANCGIRLEGNFSAEAKDSDPFSQCTGEEIAFIDSFVRSEGRLDDVSNELDLSFTQAKARLATIRQKLEGAAALPAAPSSPGPATAAEPLRPVRPTDVRTQKPAPLRRAVEPAVPEPPATQAAVPPVEPAGSVASTNFKPVPDLPSESAPAPSLDSAVPADILDALDAGRISYEDALDRLSKLST